MIEKLIIQAQFLLPVLVMVIPTLACSGGPTPMRVALAISETISANSKKVNPDQYSLPTIAVSG